MSRIVIIEGQDQDDDKTEITSDSPDKGKQSRNNSHSDRDDRDDDFEEPRRPRIPRTPEPSSTPWAAVASLIAIFAILAVVATFVFIFASTTAPTGTASKQPSGKTPTTAVKICEKGNAQDGCICPEKKKGKACVQMVKMAAGTFTMGTNILEIKKNSPDLYEEFADAQFRHGVTFQSPFWVSKFEVTFDQWDACYFGRNKYKGYVDEEGKPIGCQFQPYDDGWGRGDRPVINVSWNEAQQYLKWLSRETGKNIRLLTEAEWEYMARGGELAPSQHIAYAFTDDLGTLLPLNSFGEPSPFHANFQPRHVQEISERECEYRRRTVPQYYAQQQNLADQLSDCSQALGSQMFFPYINNANPAGIHFVHGNVWEWVQDCYVATYKGGPFDGSSRELDDGQDGVSCEKRVLRGGSWGSASHAIRVDYRNNRAPDLKNNAVGFRIAWTDGDCIIEGCGKKKKGFFNFSRGNSGKARTSGRTSSSSSSSSYDDDDDVEDTGLD